MKNNSTKIAQNVNEKVEKKKERKRKIQKFKFSSLRRHDKERTTFSAKCCAVTLYNY